jgi:acyl-CoA reductase-like NAD-dependent aldehyde dehydrogenase
MKHPGVRLLVVTGGPAVVKEAMNSGKKAIAAGPGNPPAVVDETAHLDQAARGIVLGASIDNNIICSEKEVVAVPPSRRPRCCAPAQWCSSRTDREAPRAALERRGDEV